MTWTSPDAHVWATNEILTAANMNTYIRQNLDFLAGSIGATVATSESTASGTYVDLATTGPSITVVTLTTALVIVSCGVANGAMSFAVSGATTIAPVDATCFSVSGTSVSVQGSFLAFLAGLTAGANTFTAKYRSNSGTAGFNNRNIVVIPLTT